LAWTTKKLAKFKFLLLKKVEEGFLQTGQWIPLAKKIAAQKK
jgi:hypothetical protein